MEPESCYEPKEGFVVAQMESGIFMSTLILKTLR